jgi:hypothetical protein
LSDNSQYPDTRELARRAAQIPIPQPVAPASPSGLVSWLAKRLKEPVEVLASRIDDDTLRRTKYPFTAVDNGDGTTTFKEVLAAPGSRRHAPTSEGSKLDTFRGGVRIQPKEE